MVKKFYLNPVHFDRWFKQNNGIYTGDFYDGCLLDNFVVMTKNGIAAFYEHYVNPNMSNYYVEFERGFSGTVLCDFWDREKQAAE